MAEVNFELYNNQLVQQLVGASDANLRLIEKILNVEISSFGNQINIKGSQDAVDQAKTAIDLLYGKVSKGIEIGEQEVKAAVRMSDRRAESKRHRAKKPKNDISIPVPPLRPNIFRK